MQQLHQELTTLNPEQRQAVMHRDGPMLVLAGAGSGKTRVATLRIAHLIATGVRPSEILGLTFTNKAAHEMKERVEKYAGAHVLVTTFHSLGARLLRESIHHLGYSQDFVIYDESDSEKLLKEVMRELGVASSLEPKALRSYISSTKNGLVVEEQEGFKVIYERYNEKLKKCNALDFDDLLRLPVELFQTFEDVLAYYQERWKYMLVDEYQDTNGAQYNFVKLLCGKRCNLFVVGDPDQSIYSWRGANIQNILNFEKDFPGATVVRLEQNYRSTNVILEAANAVITRNGGRYDKRLWSALGDGEKINFFVARSEREEARFVGKQVQEFLDKGTKPSNICLFYRTNVQSRVLEDEMLSRRIPYNIVGGVSFYLRKEIKDVLSMLRLMDNPKDVISFLRVVNLPKRGLGETTLEKIVDACEKSGLPILTFMMQTYAEDSFSSLPFTLTAKQKEGWADFANTFLMLMEVADSESLEELVRAAIFRSRYIDVIAQDSETKMERLENLEELIVKAEEWEAAQEAPTLSNFLSDTSLATSMDSEQDADAITLMTIHNGKGLEYEVAFLVGLEEDLFPHINSKKTPEQVEEERRLFYVGITRAKRHLYISTSQMRSLWGATRSMRPSRFLQEIPQKLMKKVVTTPFPAPAPMSMPKPQANQEIFSIGEKVFHPQFGLGRIENVKESSHGPMYEIFFTKDDSIKCLIAKLAPLA
ncbi:MAG: UvrD-helicase domain-containing protein, partial [Verrucomicrobia bacterium]|nr:UvrD-helicase domain-containing protein [Verrucomicrobiota bacterium]